MELAPNYPVDSAKSVIDHSAVLALNIFDLLGNASDNDAVTVVLPNDGGREKRAQ